MTMLETELHWKVAGIIRDSNKRLAETQHRVRLSEHALENTLRLLADGQTHESEGAQHP